MKNTLMVRGLVILTVLVVALLVVTPPEERIGLGLDLRGGMHLVLQVQTEDALRTETDNKIDSVLADLEDADIAGVASERTGDTTFELTGVPADRVEYVREEILDRYLGGWDMTRVGDRLRFSLTSPEASKLRGLAVNQAEETIRNRVDAFGVAEPVIHQEGLGSDRIVVQLPGVDDPERVKDLIKSTAFLEFRLVEAGGAATGTRQGQLDNHGGQMPSGVEIMAESILDDNRSPIGERYWPIETRRVITGRDLRDARVTSGQFNEPVIGFFLNREGARKFGDVTGENIGRGLAIVLDGRVVQVATIQDRITDQGVITGSFTLEEVQDVVTTLRSGALPAGMVTLEERTVGPALGQDSIDKGRRAFLIGGVMVILTMLMVYRLTGINAVVALCFNVLLVFAGLAFFGATLTLPGIAGIVLTVGMAVDANVLIFERIREELRSGRTVKSAVKAGFKKALSSILDANVTTLIAAMFLFMFGTGPIRGFAVTLSIGILASVFTAVFVSRWLFDLILSRRQRVEKLSI